MNFIQPLPPLPALPPPPPLPTPGQVVSGIGSVMQTGEAAVAAVGQQIADQVASVVAQGIPQVQTTVAIRDNNGNGGQLQGVVGIPDFINFQNYCKQRFDQLFTRVGRVEIAAAGGFGGGMRNGDSGMDPLMLVLLLNGGLGGSSSSGGLDTTTLLILMMSGSGGGDGAGMDPLMLVLLLNGGL